MFFSNSCKNLVFSFFSLTFQICSKVWPIKSHIEAQCPAIQSVDNLFKLITFPNVSISKEKSPKFLFYAQFGCFADWSRLPRLVSLPLSTFSRSLLLSDSNSISHRIGRRGALANRSVGQLENGKNE